MNTTATRTSRPATDRQWSFIESLAVEVYGADNAPEDILAMRESNPSVSDASRIIDDLKGKRSAARQRAAQPERPARPSTPTRRGGPTEEGIYKRGDSLFQVFASRNGGHLLAKELVDGSWEYRGAAGRFVQDGERLSLDEAKQYGRTTGRCIICQRLLTNPESVEAGIGPVCGGRI